MRNTGRNAQGVKLVNLDDKDVLTAVARVIPEDKEDGVRTSAGDEVDLSDLPEGEEAPAAE